MKRWLAVAIVVLMLVVPVASGATWLRSGHDPGRTGAIPFEGPQTNDTAFQAELSGVPSSEIVLDGRRAYVMTTPAPGNWGGETDGLDTLGVWRIDLDTAETELVFEMPEGADPVKILPSTVLYEGSNEEDLLAVDLDTGEERWRTRALNETPDTDGIRHDIDYIEAITIDGRLYVSIQAYETNAEGLIALDLETGEKLWDGPWFRNTAREDQRVPSTSPSSLGPPSVGPERVASLNGLSADEERVYPFFFLDPGPNSQTNELRQQLEIWAINAENGNAIWDRNSTEKRLTRFSTSGFPTVTPQRVSIRLDSFQTFNPSTGRLLWASDAGRVDQRTVLGANAMGVRGDRLVATTEQTVARLDTRTGEILWQRTNTTSTKIHGSGVAVVLDEDAAYIPSWHLETDFIGTGLDKRDTETGELLWSWKQIPQAGRPSPNSNTVRSSPAFGPGFAVFGAKDGTVHVVGETEASLGEPDVETERYPAEGEEVTIDASGAEPGVHGEATRYMVDWGDGTVSGWQTDPVFTHTYNESGEHQARVYAGNDANQTSSSVVTMNVGQEEPNWIGQQFQNHTDRTYGFLGLAVALGGGMVGVTQRYRKRSRLEEELQTLETGFEETNDRPGECEAFLETRRARARSLVLDGVLTEEQGTIIQDRADELRRELRTGALEDEFGFLPYSLVTKARQMLEDGRVTALEVEAFEAALDEVEGITDEQRTVVRERIEAWKARDEGGGAR